MPVFSASHTPAESALRLPASRRISLPASVRLSAITEDQNATQRPGERRPRDSARNSDPAPVEPSSSRHNSGGPYSVRSNGTARTGPPAYGWAPDLIDGDEDLTAPVEGEKLAQLRRAGRPKRRARGGWGRFALLLGLVLLIVIALAVGLGVGLTVGRKHHSSSQDNQPSEGFDSDQAQLPFPLGEYSLVTALKAVYTNCTSNPSTWNCYPYNIYNGSDTSVNPNTLATFNWQITNSTNMYASNETGITTSEEGIPSNLSISSTDNPFELSFSAQNLTYINIKDNSSSARYTFNFEMSKAVIPSTSLLSSGAAAKCFYNSTILSGTLYLSAPASYPNATTANNTPGVGGYTTWPFAIEISEQSPGGQDIPACYQLVNGNVGNKILTAVTPEPESQTCVCEYRNY
jgi:hypothetical protein